MAQPAVPTAALPRRGVLATLDKYKERYLLLLPALLLFVVFRNVPGTGAAKDGPTGASLGVRMISPAHIVPPVDKVYIAPHRHALQSWIESHQTPGPGIGFRPAWNEDERALAGNLKTIEQEFAWKGLTGAIDIAASWDGYVQDMMDAGLAQLLEALPGKRM